MLCLAVEVWFFFGFFGVGERGEGKGGCRLNIEDSVNHPLHITHYKLEIERLLITSRD